MNPSAEKPRILIVDDMPENIRMLMEILKDDYATIPAKNGETALNKASAHPGPDLILLDIMMPGLDGYQVCERLKTCENTLDIPVIFITAVSEVMDDAKAFDLGAADYVTKPFNPATVKARVRSQIKLKRAMSELQELYKMALDANPLTGLPGNNSIRDAIQACLDREKGLIVYVDLDNFKAFNDKYGFARGDEVIQFTSNLLKEAIASLNPEEGYLGHIGGDDFVMFIQPGNCQCIADYIISRFDEEIKKFYNRIDLEAGGIETIGRDGQMNKYPIMSISLGGVDLSRHDFDHILQVVDACTEIKKKAKEIPGSNFLLDRRTSPNKT